MRIELGDDLPTIEELASHQLRALNATIRFQRWLQKPGNIEKRETARRKSRLKYPDREKQREKFYRIRNRFPLRIKQRERGRKWRAQHRHSEIYKEKKREEYRRYKKKRGGLKLPQVINSLLRRIDQLEEEIVFNGT